MTQTREARVIVSVPRHDQNGWALALMVDGEERYGFSPRHLAMGEHVTVEPDPSYEQRFILAHRA